MTATAKSSDCGIRFFTLDKTIAVIHKASASQHIFLVVRNPQSARKLVEGGSVEIGIADLAAGILRFETRPFANFTAKEKYDELADYLQAVLAELSSPLLGIGIALPVDVDSDTGRIISAFNISGNDCQCVEENFRYLADKLGLACCQIWQRRCSTLK